MSAAPVPRVEEILVRPCLYHNAVFSPRLSYFVLECKGPGIPNARLYSTKGLHTGLHTGPHTGPHAGSHAGSHAASHAGSHAGVHAAPHAGSHNQTEPGPLFIATLQNNTRLQELASKMALPQVKTFPVQISGGYYAQVRLHLPPGLREEEITRYPLVVQV